MPDDLGTLQIGLRADLSQLTADIAAAEGKLKSMKIPEREIPIRVRISTPTEAAIAKAQRDIDKTLTKAQKLGVELTPTLAVKNVKIADFRNQIQSQLDGQKPLDVKVSADVDGAALRQQILNELGVVDIPLTWHWEGEPPPGSGPFNVGIVPPGGGGGGGGGVGPTAPANPSTGATKGTPRKQQTKPVAGPVVAPVPEPKPAKETAAPVAAAAPVKTPKAAASKPAKTQASAPVAAAVPPAPAPTIIPQATAAGATIQVPKVFTRAVPTLTKEEQVAARVEKAVVQLTRGRGEGLQEILSLGGVLGIDSNEPFKAKPRSDLAKYLKSKPEALEGIQVALGQYRQSASRDELGRPAFTGGALSLAGSRPVRSAESIDAIRVQIQQELFDRRLEFRRRPDVKALRQALQERGLDALVQNTMSNEDERKQFLGLTDIQKLIPQNPVKAREETLKVMTALFATYPKLANRLFPSKKRGIRTLEPEITDPETGELVPNPNYDVGLETTAAGLNAIFNELYKVGLPLRDIRAKEERKALSAEIQERREAGEPTATKGAIAEATERASREARAFDLYRAGFTRAKVPEEIPPQPLTLIDENTEQVPLSARAQYDPIFAEEQARQIREASAAKARAEREQAAIRAKLASKKNPIKFVGFGDFEAFPRRAIGGHVSGLWSDFEKAYPNAQMNFPRRRILGRYDSFNRIADTLTSLASEFPRTARTITRLGVPTPEEAAKIADSGVTGAGWGGVTGALWQPLRQSVLFNPLLSKFSREQNDQMFAENIASGYMPSGLEGFGHSFVAAHEFGHAFDNLLGQPSLDEKFAKNLVPNSRYGAKHPRETFADLFAATMLRGPETESEDFLADIIEGSQGMRAVGGPVKGGLMDRLAQRGYIVGEKRPETYLGDDGSVEILGRHGPELRAFPTSGKILPNVPEWVRRMDKNAKDLTHRQAGGSVEGVRFPYKGGGPHGNLFQNVEAASLQAIGAGIASPVGGGGSVQRVFVVNWPANLTARAATSAPAAAKAASPVVMPFAPGQAPNAPFAPPSPAASAPKAPRASKAKATPTPALSPEEEITARIDLLKRQTVRQFDIKLLSAQQTSIQRQVPTRGVQTAFGEITAESLGGRAGITQRARLAQGATQLAVKLESQLTKEEDKLFKLESKREALVKNNASAKEIAKQTTRVTEQQAAIAKLNTALGEAKSDAAKYTSAIASGSDKLRVFTANTAGIIGGTLLFSTALGAAQAGLEGVNAIFGPILERMGGFTNSSARMTDELSNQSQGAGGDSKSIVQLALAQSGLGTATANSIGPLLEQRVATEEGNKQLESQLNLLHTFEDARRRGGNEGLFSTTGGFGGTFLGGTASTQELIKNELNSADVKLTDEQKQAIASGGKGSTTRQILTAGRGGGVREITVDFNTDLKGVNAKLELLQDRMDLFNGDLQRGGSSLKFVQVASQEVADKFGGIAAKAGATELGQAAHENRVILVDQNGSPVDDGEKIRSALQSINIGAQTPNVDVLIQQLQNRVIPAMVNQINAESELQRKFIIPAQAALDELANPTTALGAGSFSQGIVGQTRNAKGQLVNDKDAQKIANAYEKQVGGAIEDVNTMIADGHDALVNLVPQDLRGQFEDLLSKIESTGKQIQGIQLGVQQRQVNLEVAQYNNELRMAKRSLQDARDLEAGLAGATKQSLGGIEGQNALLERQLQLLGFELAQRQINFQRAVAGFVAPGTTPEERAARIEEAKTEADFAQKQLDLQKQIGANSFKTIKITADRNITDLVQQIGLLQQGREVVISNAAAARALDVLNKKQSLLVQQAGTYLQQGIQITQAAISAAAEAEKQTGAAFSYILSQTAKAWGIFGEQARLVLNALTRTAPTSGERPQNPNGPGPTAYATGVIGDTLGMTSITVGEAGREHVAVIRNPRNISLTALSGAATGPMPIGAPSVTVIVTGNKVSDSADEERLANNIAKKVEDTLMRKTSLFGLRRAS